MKTCSYEEAEKFYSASLKNIRSFPSHVAIIMDGNRRWAKKQLNGADCPSFGHEYGYVALCNLICFVSKIERIKTLTVYAFSTENWNRTKEEVDAILALSLRVFTEKINDPDLNGIRIRVLGSREGLSPELSNAIEKVEVKTENNQGMVLVIAFNYGGHWDLSEGCKRLNSCVHFSSQNSPLEQWLPSSFLPPVDLLIRTGGEKRISNFLLWQIAYAELFFIDTLWPDFSPKDFVTALEVFSLRTRRFGADSSDTSKLNTKVDTTQDSVYAN